MKHTSFDEHKKQYNQADLAFFELMRSISNIHEHEHKHELSEIEIEQIKISARILNSIIARNASSMSPLQAA